MKVHFAYKSILVARSRTVDLYPIVELRPPGDAPVVYPLRSHTFGWIDGIAVGPVSDPDYFCHYAYPPLAILVRAESGDPWESNIHYVQKYMLCPNASFDASAIGDDDDIVNGRSSSSSSASRLPTFPFTVSNSHSRSRHSSPPPPSPYLFPPVLVSTIPSTRGFLRCPSLALGRAGTALWIHSWRVQMAQPFEVTLGPSPGLGETLCAAVFPGPLTPGHGEMDSGRVSRSQLRQDGQSDRDGHDRQDGQDGGGGNDGGGYGNVTPMQLYLDPGARTACRVTWTSLDYVESRGCIALGGVDGSVTVLYMV